MIIPNNTVSIIPIFVIPIAYVNENTAITRQAQDTIFHASFSAPSTIDGIQGLRWAVPTYLSRDRDFKLDEAEVSSIAAFLKEKNKPFFIYPDFTLLYAMCKTLPPQPLLWFHPGVTYSINDSKFLDTRIVSGLKRNDVYFVVLEQRSFLSGMLNFPGLPELANYIQSEFHRRETIGNFTIFERLKAVSNAHP